MRFGSECYEAALFDQYLTREYRERKTEKLLVLRVISVSDTDII